jgi:O-methyltransferase
MKLGYGEFLNRYDRVACYSVSETKYNTFIAGKYVNDYQIEGSIVECGIAAGGNFALLKAGCEYSSNKIQRKYWGFDSFIGIQLGGKHDDGQPGLGPITWNVDVPDDDLLVSSGMTVHSKENVISNLTDWGMYDSQIELVEGWIQKTLTDEVLENIGKIAVLRLDMDMYAPTKFSIEKLYPLISTGGLLIIDDWALKGARQACSEFFNSNGIQPQHAEIEDLIKNIPGTDIPYFVKG